jgi:secondary thiamine-phosphate synthase enzyme
MTRFTLEVPTDGPLTGEGVLHLFLVGSTAALTTLEFEPGLVKHDIAETLQRLIPDNAQYQHEATWNDDNGHSHVRAALIGPSLTVPYAKGRLLTGEYQQVVLMEFDTQPRRRTIICSALP